MIFPNLQQILLFADVTEAFPEGVREAGSVVRRRRDKAEFSEKSVSPAFDTVEVIREKLGRIDFGVFLLKSNNNSERVKSHLGQLK